MPCGFESFERLIVGVNRKARTKTRAANRSALPAVRDACADGAAGCAGDAGGNG